MFRDHNHQLYCVENLIQNLKYCREIKSFLSVNKKNPLFFITFDERRTMSVKIVIFYYNISYFNLKIFK